MNTAQLTDEELMNTEYVPSVIEPEVITESEPEKVIDPVVEEEVVVPEETLVEDTTDKPILNDDDFEKESNPLDFKAPKEEVKDGTDKTTEPTTVNYESFYKQIMSTFKANGKMIELKDPQEAVQLMQMGANYTRKMQDLQAVKKQLTMLENNGLLDEGKLSFLIDLDKRDPEAIKKLLKEGNIDPLDLDITSETTYQAGNHIVSDDEVKFRSVLDAVSATPEGKATLQVIHTSWDQASKDALWASPDIMEVISEQRTNGIYDRVTAEIERQTVLGGIKQGTSFLTAYQSVGQLLGQQGAFNDIAQKPNSDPVFTGQVNPVAPIATKVATPKSTVSNNPQVAAAAQTRTSGKRSATIANLAGLNDDDFMKQFAGRL